LFLTDLYYLLKNIKLNYLIYTVDFVVIETVIENNIFNKLQIKNNSSKYSKNLFSKKKNNFDKNIIFEKNSIETNISKIEKKIAVLAKNTIILEKTAINKIVQNLIKTLNNQIVALIKYLKKTDKKRKSKLYCKI